MTNDDSRFRRSEVSHINRRAVLRGVGAAGVAGVAGVGTVSARHQGKGPQEECGCIDNEDTEAWGKYDFQCVEYDEDEEECIEWDFVLTEGYDAVDIMGWDGKDGDQSEPITVYFEVKEGYALVGEVCAFGGRDNHSAEPEDDNGSYRYESDLENRGGQQAAISNLVFCVMEVEEALSQCPFYGTSRADPTSIFGIRYDPDAGEIVEVEVGNIPDDDPDSNYPNGVAFDDDNDVWYFAEKNGDLKTMNEDGTLGIEEYGVVTPGGEPIAGAAFWDATGEYLYIPNGTNRLMAADISGGSAVTRDVVTLDWSNIGLGDLAIDRDEANLYVSTTRTAEVGPNFFRVDLDNLSDQSEIVNESAGDRTEYAHSSQIAFDDGDATLWAHNAGNGEWRTVDLSDGSLSEVRAVTREYTDLARCGFADVGIPEIAPPE